MGILARFVGTAATLLMCAYLIPGFFVANFYTALIVALVLGVISVTLKPILMLITLPINLITLGLFSFVINAGILLLVAHFVAGFTITGFVPALVAALVLSVVHWLLEHLIK